MKNVFQFFTVVILTVSLFFSVKVNAQAPQKMSYQAVVRNSSDQLVVNQSIGMRISILQGSETGTEVYKEIFNPNPQTNQNGLVSIEIGGGIPLTGIFSNIDWTNGPYFVKTETDPTGGTNYTITGVSQLLSIPYALHSKTAETLSNPTTETDPVFGASPANGITGTDITNWNNKLDSEIDGSVTNELQTLSISNDTVYLTNGGFVKLPAGFDGQYSSLTGAPTNVSSFTNDAGYITGFTEIDGSVTNELQTLSISNDTVYLSNGGFVKLPAETDPNAWSKSGNAGTIEGVNFIGTTDSTSLDFRTDSILKIRFTTKGQIETYNNGNSVFIGKGAGENDDLGNNSNVFIGYEAGKTNIHGAYNIAIGSIALQQNISGANNIALG